MKLTDTYTAKTLADARAAALQGIDIFVEDGFDLVCIEAEKAEVGYIVTVTYERAGE